MEKKDNELSGREKSLRESKAQASEKLRKLDEMMEEERQKLQQVSGMSSDEAKQILMDRLEDQVRHESHRYDTANRNRGKGNS